MGEGWFLFSRAVLGTWSDATLECAQWRSRLHVAMSAPDSCWVMGRCEDAADRHPPIPLAGPGEPANHFLSALDVSAPPRTALPPHGEAHPFLGFTGQGALGALWSMQTGQWKAENPRDLLDRCLACPVYSPGLAGYRPEGVPGQIESIISRMGEDPLLARRGRRAWSIRRGTAVLHLNYAEERALLSAEVHLVCIGPHTRRKELMAYLLQQNVLLSGYGFSLQEDTVIIALVLPARFLQEEGTAHLLQGLLGRCDDYDNVLVSHFNAEWLPI
jgi:hypothetical protein